MSGSGKDLEALVAFVEQQFLSSGCKVTSNHREYDNAGDQLAEFDIVVTGKLGSTEMRWLIECRDRPAQGPAPGAWIEQLDGRKRRFDFNKVTAVSTSGFSPSATDAAASAGIELRSVASLDAENFRDWLQLSGLHWRKYVHDLKHCQIAPPPDATPEQVDALFEALKNVSPGALLLRAVKTGELVDPKHVFLGVASEHPSLKEGLDETSPPKPVTFTVQWPTDDHFVIDTAVGPVRVFEATLFGEIRVETDFIPVGSLKEYRNEADGSTLSQFVGFEVPLEQGTTSLELHRIPDKGIYVLARPSGAKDQK